jgi:uncharacterized membrane protein YfcA
MHSFDVMAVIIGAFLGGLVSGTIGFAFSAVAGAVILHFYPNIVAVPLMMMCGAINQGYCVLRLREVLHWRASMPLIVGGLIGVPMGLFLLHVGNPSVIRALFGAMLSAYAAFMLLRPATLSLGRKQGAGTDTALGFASGVLGGLTAMPGALPTVWCDLRGLPKLQKRAFTQPFIMVMQVFAIALLICAGRLNNQALELLAISTPSLLLGTTLGLAIFDKVNELAFRRAVLSLLFISGVGLLWR